MNYPILGFTIFCIDNVARTLGLAPRDIYHRMQDADIIDGYIVPCYDILHTFSKEYIVEELISLMQKRGLLT